MMGARTPLDPSNVEELRQALANASSLSEAVSVRTRADVLLANCRNLRSDLAVRNDIAEVLLRAERHAGHILAGMHLRGGSRKPCREGQNATKLSELGLDRNDSSRWQKVASISTETFEAYTRKYKLENKLMTRAGLFRYARLTDIKSDLRYAASLADEMDQSFEEIQTHLGVLSDMLKSLKRRETQALRPAELRFAIQKTVESTVTLARIRKRIRRMLVRSG